MRYDTLSHAMVSHLDVGLQTLVVVCRVCCSVISMGVATGVYRYLYPQNQPQ